MSRVHTLQMRKYHEFYRVMSVTTAALANAPGKVISEYNVIRTRSTFALIVDYRPMPKITHVFFSERFGNSRYSWE